MPRVSTPRLASGTIFEFGGDEVGEADAAEGAVHRLADPLPGLAHVAAPLLGARARVERALGQPDRTLERGDHLGDADPPGGRASA